ncbi:MAG: cell division protein FtsZ [Bacteroidales bacterium]|jgi:cell division protein FtsZ|nr:cell division protein FtsZ [Bacteroidota bacterium]NLN98802.1 cell division protein FtsZ [Bacteroidales bacterium]
MGDNLDFEIRPSNWTEVDSMIKVIGVGGGGCNAVNYMYRKKIEGCSFVVCNTDLQALQNSPVPVKLHIGRDSLGAGTDPTKGRNAAIEAVKEIETTVLGPETRMLFITAGMGGGTGTGAAPIIAKMAKDRGILTVAVVTIPFKNEGSEALGKAADGLQELRKNVDSMLIINNEKLYEFFGDTLIQDAFPKADEVLATAVRGITGIISKHGYINVDFQDIKTMMTDSGMALMGCGIGTGKDRIEDAVRGALDSPLLNDFDLSTAKNMLLNITAGRNEEGLKMDGLNEIDRLIEKYAGNVNRFKRGIVYEDDKDFGDQIRITVIATGFSYKDLSKIIDVSLGNIVIIDENFVYTPAYLEPGEEIDLPEPAGVFRKIGYNKGENERRFHFSKDDKPVLLVDLKANMAELENTPAIKRMAKTERES